jgi:hypothetical protein
MIRANNQQSKPAAQNDNSDAAEPLADAPWSASAPAVAYLTEWQLPG